MAVKRASAPAQQKRLHGTAQGRFTHLAHRMVSSTREYGYASAIVVMLGGGRARSLRR